jgi:hypothetical protein
MFQPADMLSRSADLGTSKHPAGFSSHLSLVREKKRMFPKVHQDERPTEDDKNRERLGPRGIPGEPDKAKMTPQRDKKTPAVGEFDGHTA